MNTLLGNENITTEQVEKVMSTFRDSGAFDACKSCREELLLTRQQALDEAQPPFNSKYKYMLIELSDFLVKRTH